MNPATTTLQKLCTDNLGVIAARCQYLGPPHPYNVDGICAETKLALVYRMKVEDAKERLDGALRMAPFIEDYFYRVLFTNKKAILVMRHPTLTECHIAVLYDAGSHVSKSLFRMIRRQFKFFTNNSIQVEPGTIRLGDNPLPGVPTQFESDE